MWGRATGAGGVRGDIRWPVAAMRSLAAGARHPRPRQRPRPRARARLSCRLVCVGGLRKIGEEYLATRDDSSTTPATTVHDASVNHRGAGRALDPRNPPVGGRVFSRFCRARREQRPGKRRPRAGHAVAHDRDATRRTPTHRASPSAHDLCATRYQAAWSVGGEARAEATFHRGPGHAAAQATGGAIMAASRSPPIPQPRLVAFSSSFARGVEGVVSVSRGGRRCRVAAAGAFTRASPPYDALLDTDHRRALPPHPHTRARGVHPSQRLDTQAPSPPPSFLPTSLSPFKAQTLAPQG